MDLISFVVENTWLPRCIRDFGWGNGYVAVPKEHKLHGLDYYEIEDIANIEVNGGLTLSCSASKFNDTPELTEEFKDYWVLGFDTAHLYDSLEKWPKEAVEKETNYLKLQLEKIGGK